MNFKPSLNCIYCGKSGVKLDREHIIPFGLGGQWVMPSASCKDCAKITSQVELLVLRKMYLPLRTKANYPTRDKKNRPKSFKATIIKADGNREVISVPAATYPTIYPTIYPVVHLPSPGILGKEELSKNNPEIKIDLAGNQDEINAFAAAHPDAIEFKFSWELSLNALYRVLAKIAHSYIVSHYGTVAYTPLLPSLILGDHPDPSSLVGGAVHIDESRVKKSSDGLELVLTNEGHIIVNIDIMGGRFPTYSVVAGLVHDWDAFMTHVSHTGVEGKKEYAHSMRTRFMFIHEWVIWIIQLIRHAVERDHPTLVTHWPLLGGYSFDAYALPPAHYLLILKNSSEDIRSGPDNAVALPHKDHPNLPPSIKNLDAWQQWCRSNFSLSHDQWPIILPVHDLGKTHNVKEESELFNEEEKELWIAQLNYLISMQLQQAIPNSYEGMPEYAHGMRTRFGFIHEWVIRIMDAIRYFVERDFPNLKARWPLLAGYSFDAYALPPTHYLLILKSTTEEIPSGPNGAIVPPHDDHPRLPPNAIDLDAWRQWCESRLLMSHDQWPILLPVHDSGEFHKVDKDYELFSEEDRKFWDAQLQYLIFMQLQQVLRKSQE